MDSIAAMISLDEARTLLESRLAFIAELQEQNSVLRETMEDLEDRIQYKVSVIEALTYDLRQAGEKLQYKNSLIESSVSIDSVVRGLVVDEFLRVKNRVFISGQFAGEPLNKIRVIKAVRAALSVNLKIAKDLVDPEWERERLLTVMDGELTSDEFVKALSSGPKLEFEDEE